MDQKTDQQERDDVEDLDHRIDCGAGGVFVGISHGVAGDCRGVRERAFTALVAVFD